ncbi:glutathione transferase GstA [Celerinatantimonas sp. YJH-8]|uniref:glutathione transferase GstA n=1 Tax=Celerinatantimonas sp. YJH-8 TaxID=3228714 RepID=UPI0038BF6ECD
MKLYYTPGACSVAVHIVLEELSLPYQLEKVDLREKKTETGADYLSLNSKGYVPALGLDDGTVLTEGLVINQYLADLKPEAALIPASGIERYQLQSLMVFIATELHKPMASLFNPSQSDDARISAIRLLHKRLDWLSTHMSGEFVFGPHFSIADAYLYNILRWHTMVKFDLAEWPDLENYMQRISQRPSVQKALTMEGLI